MNVTDSIRIHRFIDLDPEERFEWETTADFRTGRSFKFFVSRLTIQWESTDEPRRPAVKLRGPGILKAGDGFQTGAIYREQVLRTDQHQYLPEQIRALVDEAPLAPAWMIPRAIA